MKVLLDECSPAPIKRALKDVQVFTIEDAGLKGFSNGDLIAIAETDYDILITADKNLRYQQNLTQRTIAIIELPYNSWPKLKGLIPILEATNSRAQPGDYLVIPPSPSVLP